MPLLTIWKSAPEAVAQMSIEQVVSSAGNGVLKDSSSCSYEFREYLAQIPTSKIASYIEHCLSTAFNKGGMVLQDLVNELGRRLDYKVTNGRYQGIAKEIGFDGLWLSPEGQAIIAEVKTTDAYRVSLETIAGYRTRLLANGQVSLPSSILIVVGREDTGELEAQVRGSRHAWDMRLISAEALIKLVQLKENTEGSETGLKIRSLLVPMEYTRLDGMIDIMFTAAKDAEGANSTTESELEIDDAAPGTTPGTKEKGVWQLTDRALLQDKRNLIVESMARQSGVAFIKKTRVLFWTADHNKRFACSISKRYENKGSNIYWFAFHPQWLTFLSDCEEAFLILGCMDLNLAFSMPLAKIVEILPALNTTTKDDGTTYWHIHIVETKSSQYSMSIPKRSELLSLDNYQLYLNASIDQSKRPQSILPNMEQPTVLFHPK